MNETVIVAIVGVAGTAISGLVTLYFQSKAADRRLADERAAADKRIADERAHQDLVRQEERLNRLLEEDAARKHTVSDEALEEVDAFIQKVTELLAEFGPDLSTDFQSLVREFRAATNRAHVVLIALGAEDDANLVMDIGSKAVDVIDQWQTGKPRDTKLVVDMLGLLAQLKASYIEKRSSSEAP